MAMADGFQRLLLASTETCLWSWLSFLNAHEILLVSDLLSKDVRQRVESDPTLWPALVAQVFPRAALTCVLKPSVAPPPALPGSWKELFQVLTRLQDAHHSGSCLDVVPVRVLATHQVQVVAQSRLFCLTLPGGMSYSDSVYLRERLQDLHVLHKSKTNGLAKRKARSSVKNLVMKQAKACFVLTLRGTRLVLESSLLPSSQLCTVQLHDIVEIKTASEGPYFVIDVPWERIHVRVKTPESAQAWVATVKLARARCLLEATVHNKLSMMTPSTQSGSSAQRTTGSSAGKARLRRLTTRLSSLGVSKLASWLPRTNSAPLAYYATPIKLTIKAQDCAAAESDRPRILVPAVTPVGILPPTPQYVIHKLPQGDLHGKRTPPSRSQSATTSEGSRESDVKDPGDSRQPARTQRWFLPRRRRERESSASSRSSAYSTFDPDDLGADNEQICVFVRRLLQSNEHFEGQVCMRFLKQMDQFRSTTPSDCSSYLTKVRDCIQDLVQFVLTFRGDELRSMDQLQPEKLEANVQHAVESHFCSCTHQQLTKWATTAAEIHHTRRFRHRLSRWSRLPPSSAEFGLANEHTVDQCEFMQIAISRLRRIGLEATPSRKLTALMAAVRALSASLSQKERTKHEQQQQLALHTANDLLPVFIFAVCRSKMRDPLLQCALLRGLARFESAHGEAAYYLTMLEASLEYVRRYE